MRVKEREKQGTESATVTKGKRESREKEEQGTKHVTITKGRRKAKEKEKARSFSCSLSWQRPWRGRNSCFSL